MKKVFVIWRLGRRGLRHTSLEHRPLASLPEISVMTPQTATAGLIWPVVCSYHWASAPHSQGHWASTALLNRSAHLRSPESRPAASALPHRCPSLSKSKQKQKCPVNGHGNNCLHSEYQNLDKRSIVCESRYRQHWDPCMLARVWSFMLYTVTKCVIF